MARDTQKFSAMHRERQVVAGYCGNFKGHGRIQRTYIPADTHTFLYIHICI